MRRLRQSLALLMLAGALAAPLALGAPVSVPTVKSCADGEAAVPGRTSRIANVVECLWPKSIRMQVTADWTTCPTTPKLDSCPQGSISLTFRSTAPGFALAPGLVQPEPQGGSYSDAWAAWALPGIGTYRCEAYDVDRQYPSAPIGRYVKTVPLRDQAVGFAAVGNAIRISTAVHPGYRGPLGRNADVKLGLKNTCVVVGPKPGPEVVRTFWPGKTVSATSLRGASTTVTSSGTAKRSFPAPVSFGLASGARIDVTLRWSSTIVVVPQRRG